MPLGGEVPGQLQQAGSQPGQRGADLLDAVEPEQVPGRDAQRPEPLGPGQVRGHRTLIAAGAGAARPAFGPAPGRRRAGMSATSSRG